MALKKREVRMAEVSMTADIVKVVQQVGELGLLKEIKDANEVVKEADDEVAVLRALVVEGPGYLLEGIARKSADGCPDVGADAVGGLSEGLDVVPDVGHGFAALKENVRVDRESFGAV